jgi:hypothetical protein
VTSSPARSVGQRVLWAQQQLQVLVLVLVRVLEQEQERPAAQILMMPSHRQQRVRVPAQPLRGSNRRRTEMHLPASRQLAAVLAPLQELGCSDTCAHTVG